MKTIRPNGTKIQGKSFESILQDMLKLTTKGAVRSANNTNYYPRKGA